MKNQMLKAIGGASLAILMAVFAQVWVSAQDNETELLRNGNGGNERSLIGSWDVQVSIRDCQSGEFLFGFPAMITYNQGGTMQESDLGAPVLTRLNGHGVWERQHGRQYSAAFRWLNFNPDRTFAGTSVVRSAISPYFAHQLVFLDHLPAVPNEIEKRIENFRRERDLLAAAFRQQAFGDVNAKFVELINL